MAGTVPRFLADDETKERLMETCCEALTPPTWAAEPYMCHHTSSLHGDLWHRTLVFEPIDGVNYVPIRIRHSI